MQQENVNISEENNEKALSEQESDREDNAIPENGEEHSLTGEREAEVEKLRVEIAELKDKYLRQVAEFDNFRKRSARESLEQSKTAGKDVIISLLDVLDDSERATKQIDQTNEAPVIKEGVQLVFNKFRNILYSKGLKSMESIGQDFNPDMHEAIAEVPAPDPASVGKIIDEVQKGYYLNDKIIRFAKVVVGK